MSAVTGAATDVRTQAPHPAPDVLPPLAIYIHIPWCVRKCPYCDFNSHAAPEALPVDAYVDALLADLDADLADAPETRDVCSVFFGGGTPSLMPGTAIARILDGVRQRLAFAPDCEITLEANPGTVEHDRFESYRAAGVNRLSLGVQSFDDTALHRLGRIHDAAQAVHAAAAARAAGFDNFNLDLMFALPGQTERSALDDIDQALALGPTHLSHYQLTIEPNTVFAARPPALPDHDLAWGMQEACQARLANARFAHYEVSAYARAGRECRHNLNYWQYGDYLGIGAGAHAKRTHAGAGIERRWKVKQPRSYLAHRGAPGRIGGRQWLAAGEIPFDYALNALRLHRGFALADFEARTGLPREAIARALHDGRARGWLDVSATTVSPTLHGRNFLNDVLELFLVATPVADRRIPATIAESVRESVA